MNNINEKKMFLESLARGLFESFKKPNFGDVVLVLKKKFF